MNVHQFHGEVPRVLRDGDDPETPGPRFTEPAAVDAEGAFEGTVQGLTIPASFSDLLAADATADLTLEGRVPMELPEEFSRISDFLNFPQDFFAVETDEGLFAASTVLNLPPDSTGVVVLTLHPAVGESARRGFPGREGEDPAGLAEMLEKVRGRAFWKSARGVAVLAGGAGLLLLLLAGGDSSSDEAISTIF